MRLFCFALIILFTSCQSFDTNTNLETAFVPMAKSQSVDLEDHVDEALEQMYPKIGKYKILTKQKTCVVDFIMGGNIYKVKFDIEGNWVKTEVIIAYEFTLPEQVQKLLKDPEFIGWIIIEKKLDQTPEKINYKFMFKRGEEIMSIWVDRNGEVIKDKTDKQQLIK